MGTDSNAIAERLGKIACQYDKDPSVDNFNLFIKFCVPLFSRSTFKLMPPYRVNMAMREQFIKDESLSINFRPILGKITCPVLQLAGERDPTHPAVCAETTATCFPNAEFILFKDAGAPVYQDQKDLFNITVNSFLDKLIENWH